MKYTQRKDAILLLEDGTVFYGKSVANLEGPLLAKFVLILV